MSRINTNISSMIAQRVLTAQNKGLVTSLERLSTGLRINRGADDPAGLIASENLRSEKKALSAAISNAQRAEQVVNVAEGGLAEINNLLVELQGLIGQTANEAGLSQEERDANQLQIDSILQTIDRVANATSFNGTKLLNGNFDYTTSGINTALLDDVSINSVKLADAATLAITVTVQTSAQRGDVYLSTGTTYNGAGALTIEVTGNDGVQQFTFASGTSQANIITAINSFKDAIGVSAAQSGTTAARVELRSTGFGTEAFVRAKQLQGGTANLVFADATTTTASNDIKETGVDGVFLINGISATTNGLTARVASDGFDVSITIDGDSTLNVNAANTTFTVTGGGADFNLAPKVNLAGKVSLGISTVTTGNLGDGVTGTLADIKSGGTANAVNGSLTNAQKIIDGAIKSLSGLRGRLGAFQKNTVQATINSLSISLENTSAAESAIRDTDFAKETAELTRQQILSQAATQALAIANAQPQAVLALLG